MFTETEVVAGLGCDVEPVPGVTRSQPASELAEAWKVVGVPALVNTVTICGGGLEPPAVARNRRPAGCGSGLAESVVIKTARVAEYPPASVTLSVKGIVPALKGVPESTPAFDSVSPVPVSEPAARLHRLPPRPSSAKKVSALYTALTSPTCGEIGTCEMAFTRRSENVFVAAAPLLSAALTEIETVATLIGVPLIAPAGVKLRPVPARLPDVILQV